MENIQMYEKDFNKCYKDFKLNSSNEIKVYECKNGTIHFRIIDGDVCVDYVKEKESFLLKDFIINMLPSEEICLPGLGDYLEEFGLKNYAFNGKHYINVGGDGVLVDENIDVKEYVKNRGW